MRRLVVDREGNRKRKGLGTVNTMAEAKRSEINGFGIEFEGKTGLSKSDFSWAA